MAPTKILASQAQSINLYKNVGQNLIYFNLLINTCCVIDCNKLLHYYNTTVWLLLKF